MYQSVLGLGLTFPPFEVTEIFPSAASSLERMIGEGGHRIVYQHGNLAIKVAKPAIVAKVRSHKVVLPSWVYSLYRNGFRNFNSAEFYNFMEIQEVVPKDISDSFMHVYGLDSRNCENYTNC